VELSLNFESRDVLPAGFAFAAWRERSARLLVRRQASSLACGKPHRGARSQAVGGEARRAARAGPCGQSAAVRRSRPSPVVRTLAAVARLMGLSSLRHPLWRRATVIDPVADGRTTSPMRWDRSLIMAWQSPCCYPLEGSHRFAGIQPNSGHRDYSRLSCDSGHTQLGPRGWARSVPTRPLSPGV
jgi:hypothetical protein